MSIHFPKEFQKYFPENELQFEKLSKILLAIDLYLKEKVSLGKAAELSGLNFEDFINELKLRKIRRLTGYESVEDLENEQKDFLKFGFK